ncbi:hypothetical protein NDU88_010423 [Pleurodeles waltl]|uniref:Uncharacterized protein n=1 Tax=Pleurodeles waltl TaxID=8319 RepID=A0AAV7S3A6_PLEWA|nr:hypothetical protein NDU88_010423 [Pleurodeles waltl]
MARNERPIIASVYVSVHAVFQLQTRRPRGVKHYGYEWVWMLGDYDASAAVMRNLLATIKAESFPLPVTCCIYSVKTGGKTTKKTHKVEVSFTQEVETHTTLGAKNANLPNYNNHIVVHRYVKKELWKTGRDGSSTRPMAQRQQSRTSLRVR